MPVPNTHIINRSIFDFSIESKEKALGFRQELQDVYERLLLQKIEAVFDKVTDNGEIIRIDKLELDIGHLKTENWESQLLEKVETKLTELVRQYSPATTLYEPGATAAGREAILKQQQEQAFSEVIGLAEAVIYYLRNGSLPWFIADAGEDPDPEAYFIEVLEAQPEWLIRQLQEPGYETTVFSRINNQFETAVIKQFLAKFDFVNRWPELNTVLQVWNELTTKQKTEQLGFQLFCLITEQQSLQEITAIYNTTDTFSRTAVLLNRCVALNAAREQLTVKSKLQEVYTTFLEAIAAGTKTNGFKILIPYFARIEEQRLVDALPYPETETPLLNTWLRLFPESLRENEIPFQLKMQVVTASAAARESVKTEAAENNLTAAEKTKTLLFKKDGGAMLFEKKTDPENEDSLFSKAEMDEDADTLYFDNETATGDSDFTHSKKDTDQSEDDIIIFKKLGDPDFDDVFEDDQETDHLNNEFIPGQKKSKKSSKQKSAGKKTIASGKKQSGVTDAKKKQKPGSPEDIAEKGLLKKQTKGETQQTKPLLKKIQEVPADAEKTSKRVQSEKEAAKNEQQQTAEREKTKSFLEPGKPYLAEIKEKVNTPSTATAAENQLYKSSTSDYQPPKWLSEDEGKRTVVRRAGVVLIAPYLPALFGNINMLDAEGNFVSEEQQFKAVHLLNFIAGGKTRPHEYALALPKIICGLNISHPVPRDFKLTKKDKNEAIELLDAVAQQWTAMKTESGDALRLAFMQRNGILEKKDNAWLLRIERSSIDIMLDTLPWSLSMIKHSWMKTMLHIEW